MKYQLKNKTIELTDEEVKETTELSQEKREDKGIEIKSIYGAVIYTSTKQTIKEAVEEAVSGGAYLYGANLSGANLREAYLRGADLRGANLRGAELFGAEMQNVKFYGKGGTTRIKKDQLNDFLKAIGVIMED